MATSSAASGFLAPSQQEIYDQALEDVLQETIVGITGLAGNMVRPMWQVEPSNTPSFTTNWIAFGIREEASDTFPYERHIGTGDGSTSLERDELLTVLHSFWGPNSAQLVSRYRNGLALSQNRDALRAYGITVVEVRAAITVPSLLKEKWVPKKDVQVVFRRRAATVYPILNVLSADALLDTEVQQVPIHIQHD